MKTIYALVLLAFGVTAITAVVGQAQAGRDQLSKLPLRPYAPELLKPSGR